jgi:uncharacterized phage protein (TIGR01671 family)
MREILFKGKTKDNFMWVIGYYCHQHLFDIHSIIDPSNGNSYGVNPDSVGEYTGLCDNNGMRIFEGDIVRVAMHDEDTLEMPEYICEIIFTDAKSDWPHSFCMVNKAFYKNHAHLKTMWSIEVIGNKFDNPELLEEVK